MKSTQKPLFTINISYLGEDVMERCPFVSYNKGKREPTYFLKKLNKLDLKTSTSYYFYSLEDFKKSTNISDYLKEFIFTEFSKKLALL